MSDTAVGSGNGKSGEWPTATDWARANNAVSRLAARLRGDNEALDDIGILLDLVEKYAEADR